MFKKGDVVRCKDNIIKKGYSGMGYLPRALEELVLDEKYLVSRDQVEVGWITIISEKGESGFKASRFELVS